MPRFRPDVAAISPYVPGRSIEEVAAEIGMRPDEIVKLASNESPDGPFPGVVEAVSKALAESNRYPDDDMRDLSATLSAHLSVPADHLWFGNGSVGLIGHIAVAMGGPGTSAVYAWPSFIMYRIASRWAMTEMIEVPLDAAHTHDLDAMRNAIRDDTTVVYLCNPNNPTGTIVSANAMSGFIDSLPESVLLVIDEAYHDFVTDESYAERDTRSAAPAQCPGPADLLQDLRPRRPSDRLWSRPARDDHRAAQGAASIHSGPGGPGGGGGVAP